MSDRQRQITELCHAALERNASDRAAFLREACAGDEGLRQEVESLLRYEGTGAGFLDRPAIEEVARLVSSHPESNVDLVGRRLGVYRIEARIGAGGMGEVYRAKDSVLGRDVAIKVLPDAFRLDAERVARFEREARVLASLSHPHIASVYSFEQTAHLQGIVLELVEGPTLADQLRTGAIPVQEALAIARQIADALDAAHEKGIIHRDLKPGNIKIAPGRIVKVLDFGLAKIDAADRSADLSQSPTVTVEGTRAGAILGTAAYMSPEQARGQPTDKRTDIWSFGCVLYEMLTGRTPFPGPTVSDSIAAILSREPDWGALPGATSAPVRRMLQRCFERDPQARLRDMGDVCHELDQALIDLRPSSTSAAIPESAVGRVSSRRWAAVAAGLAVVTLIGLAAVFFLRQSAPTPSIVEPPLQLSDFNDSAIHPAVSPDGRMVTFIRGGAFANSAPRGQIYVKILPQGEPVQLTRDPSLKEQPVFSPDGSRIIYTSLTSGFKWDSWQVPVLGGAPQLFLPNASGLEWLDDQRLLYSEIMTGIHMGIVTSTESRTESRAIYWPRREGGMAHRSARSPDRKWLLVVEMNGGEWLPCRLVPFDGSSAGHAIGPPDGQCTTAAWSPDGRWMYLSSNSGGGFHIWRQKYPDGVPERITSGPTEQEGTAVTPDGKYLITSMGLQQASIWLQEQTAVRQLTSEGFAAWPTMLPSGDRMFYLLRTGLRGYWSGELWSLNLNTGEKERVLPGRVMANYSISADGRRVVFTSAGSETDDGVWIADVDRRSLPRQLTHEGALRAHFGAPGEIIYLKQLNEIRGLYRMKDDGSGSEEIATEPIVNLVTVSPDGRFAAATVTGKEKGGESSVKLISLRGEESIAVCSGNCLPIFGPNRIQAPPIGWSQDGKSVFVGLQHFGLGTARTVVLPYRSGVALKTLWPKGLNTEADVAANPGAKVIAEANVFPASTASAYLSWRHGTQSNLYRIRLPD
jgi:eukaryotic-like serine/threonine-protein kinase